MGCRQASPGPWLPTLPGGGPGVRPGLPQAVSLNLQSPALITARGCPRASLPVMSCHCLAAQIRRGCGPAPFPVNYFRRGGRDGKEQDPEGLLARDWLGRNAFREYSTPFPCSLTRPLRVVQEAGARCSVVVFPPPPGTAVRGSGPSLWAVTLRAPRAVLGPHPPPEQVSGNRVLKANESIEPGERSPSQSCVT